METAITDYSVMQEGRYTTEDLSPTSESRKVEHVIIMLEGRTLLAALWLVARSAISHSCVTEWARRIENGGKVGFITGKSRYAVSIIKCTISSSRSFLKFCEVCGIVPGGRR